MLDFNTPDLENLFIVLGLPTNEIENAKRLADTNDFQLQAKSVLQFWHQTKGKAATKQAIIDGLKKCKLKKALEILLKEWNLLTEGI